MKTGLVFRGSEPLAINNQIRESVINLEKKMAEEFGESVKDADAIAPINHHHCEGNYAREIFIKADTCVVGKIHRHEHINVLSQGKCVVVTEDGRETLEAPKTWISKPGIKRAVYAITDVVWTTVHPTKETELDKIEDEVIAPSYDELNTFLECK